MYLTRVAWVVTFKGLFFIALSLLMVFSAANIVSAADGTFHSTGHLNSLQTSSTSSGNIVVWCDDRDGPATSHVYYKSIATGASGRVSWVNSQQTNPTISGNTIVWQDTRDGGNHLFYKNIATGAGGRVSWVNSDQSKPSISGNLVVWQDDRNGGCQVYCKNIDLKAETRVSWVNSQQTNPTISGTTVVWQDNRDGSSKVYYINIATGAGTRISWVNSHQYNPTISGDLVVWEDDREAGTNHVYYKNVITGAGSRISWINSTQCDPTISGNSVVWQDNRDGGNHLYYKNMDTKAGGRISWVDSLQTNQATSFAGYNTHDPTSTAKLIFIHHSCGENWLNDSNGGLGIALRDNNYFVSDTNYGWGPDGIGDNTDTSDWPTWFIGPNSSTYMSALYNESGQNCDYSRLAADPGGENEIIMFKSCYPCSEVGDSLADEKAIYNSLKTYFAAHPEKLFILITPPGKIHVDSYQLTRELCNWLVDKDNGWLKGYNGKNVFAFDFYGVLSEVNSHHRYVAGSDSIEHVYAAIYDGNSPYHDGDDHPNAAGNQKASSEFVNLLNIVYNRWKL